MDWQQITRMSKPMDTNLYQTCPRHHVLPAILEFSQKLHFTISSSECNLMQGGNSSLKTQLCPPCPTSPESMGHALPCPGY